MELEGRAEDKNKENKKWHCQDYCDLMDGSNDHEIDRELLSVGKNEQLNLKSQRDLMLEFMKILSLAHQCSPEHFVDKEGQSQLFYNGPSPDEVALVEFASIMNF